MLEVFQLCLLITVAIYAVVSVFSDPTKYPFTCELGKSCWAALTIALMFFVLFYVVKFFYEGILWLFN